MSPLKYFPTSAPPPHLPTLEDRIKREGLKHFLIFQAGFPAGFLVGGGGGTFSEWPDLQDQKCPPRGALFGQGEGQWGGTKIAPQKITARKSHIK